MKKNNNGINFENECRKILESFGWEVNTTAVSGDYGGDLVAQKDGLRWCLQCKDTARPVGVSAIQQAAAATSYYVCDFGAVVSRSGFTDQATSLASKLNVSLVNENSLVYLGEVSRTRI